MFTILKSLVRTNNLRSTVLVMLAAIGFTPFVSAKDRPKSLFIRATNHLSRLSLHTSTDMTLGTSNTNCSEVGTTIGNTGTAMANCQTTSTAAQTYQITKRSMDVLNVVIAEGMQYTIVCRASWAGSTCAPLIDGDTFRAEIDGTTMWVIGHRGDQGKQVRAKYRILDIRPVDGQ